MRWLRCVTCITFGCLEPLLGYSIVGGSSAWQIRTPFHPPFEPSGGSLCQADLSTPPHDQVHGLSPQVMYEHPLKEADQRRKMAGVKAVVGLVRGCRAGLPFDLSLRVVGLLLGGRRRRRPVWNWWSHDATAVWRGKRRGEVITGKLLRRRLRSAATRFSKAARCRERPRSTTSPRSRRHLGGRQRGARLRSRSPGTLIASLGRNTGRNWPRRSSRSPSRWPRCSPVNRHPPFPIELLLRRTAGPHQAVGHPRDSRRRKPPPAGALDPEPGRAGLFRRVPGGRRPPGPRPGCCAG